MVHAPTSHTVDVILIPASEPVLLVFLKIEMSDVNIIMNKDVLCAWLNKKN